MSEQITTAAELDALPVGSVVLDRHGDASTHDQRGIWLSAETASMGTARLVRYGPFRVLHRPDAPVAAGATVTRDDLAQIETDLALLDPGPHGHTVAFDAEGQPDECVDDCPACAAERISTALGLTVDGPTREGDQ